MKLTFVFIAFMGVLHLNAQLAVTVSPPQISGQKAIVRLNLKNEFNERIESAKAAVFLVDENGKMVAQGTRWIIGGEKGKPGLPPAGTNVFHFVLTGSKPFATTNLTPKISFSRIVLEGGKAVNPEKNVQINVSRNDAH